MSDNKCEPRYEAASVTESKNSAVIKTLGRLLFSLARLCLANGFTFAIAEEVLKRAFVQAADALQPGAPEHGKVSRISTATGINRREVTRITKLEATNLTIRQPLASEVFARWKTEPAWQDNNGLPRALKRQGPGSSFEALAQTITRDIHPRSMLDELIRLGLVNHDEELDVVSLTRNDFVPKNDSSQMLNLLSNNVGDHLDAAIANVLHDDSQHQEQAVFADELSAESVKALRPLITANWQALRDGMVPIITLLIENDQLAGRKQNQRVRIGLYSFTEPASDNETIQKSQVARRFRSSTSKGDSK